MANQGFTIKCTIERRGVDPMLFIQRVENAFAGLAILRLRVLADETVNYMRQLIVAGKKRPDLGTHKLENAIDWEIFEDTLDSVGIGIGNIEKMNREAAYWSIIDKGGFVPNAIQKRFVPPGIFAPGLPMPASEDFRTGQWGKGAWSGDGKTYSFIPKKPIEGINYIAIATQDLLHKLETEIKTLMESQLKG